MMFPYPIIGINPSMLTVEVHDTIVKLCTENDKAIYTIRLSRYFSRDDQMFSLSNVAVSTIPNLTLVAGLKKHPFNLVGCLHSFGYDENMAD